jgi:nitrogen-specific signal transduction histidine kinase
LGLGSGLASRQFYFLLIKYFINFASEYSVTSSLKNNSLETIQKKLIDVVNNRNYNIAHDEFSKLINDELKLNNKNELEETLNGYIENAPLHFYASHLALVILSVFEKYLNKVRASQIAEKILLDKDAKKSYAFAALLRICRAKNDYSQIDELFKLEPDLKHINTFEVLYELTFYFDTKGLFESLEKTISQLISMGISQQNSAVLKTATSLCLKHGLYEKYQDKLSTPFINPSTKKSKENFVDEIAEDEYQQVIRSAALADLTNGIAHEFGQPVTNIRFAIQYYKKLFKDNSNEKVNKKEILSLFDEILQQTERIGHLNEKLSPITTTKTNIVLQDLSFVFQNLQNQEKTKLQSSNIKFDYKIRDNNPVSVKFDATQLNQVFSNLLNNSIDSILEKKEKDLDFEGRVHVNIGTVGKKVEIIFQDNGNGIDKVKIDRIFNPFFTTKAPDKGQGLGLYIVSNLLKMNGGQISIDKKFSRGARFIITI